MAVSGVSGIDLDANMIIQASSPARLLRLRKPSTFFMSSSRPRPWWRHPAPLIALLLHAAVFFGLFQLRFGHAAWQRLEQTLPPHPTTADWFHALTRDHGYWGVVTWFFDTHGEIKLYHRYAEVALRGIDPKLATDAPGQGQFRLYRDVPMEYQPGALLMFVPPAFVARNLHDYETAFTAWCGVIYVGTLLLGLHVLRGAEPLSAAIANRVLWASLAFLLCFGGVAAARFDHIVPFFCLLSLAAFARATRTDSVAWYATTGVIIASGVFVKIVPGVMLPAVLLWMAVSSQIKPWRASLALVISFAATVLILHTSFSAYWGDGYLRSYTYHLERGLQVESLYSSVIMAGTGFGVPLSTRIQFGAADLITPYTAALKALSPFLFLTLSALIAARIWFLRAAARRAPAARVVLTLSVMFLLAFMLTNKVLSPQYLIWLGPLLALAYGAQRRCLPAVIALLFAAALSQAIFPNLYDLLLELHPLPVFLLNVRNLTLVVLFGWMWWRLPRLLDQTR